MACGLLALHAWRLLPSASVAVDLGASVLLGAALFLAALCDVSRRTIADMGSVWHYLRARQS